MKAKFTTLLALGALCLQSHAAPVTWDTAPGTVGVGNGTVTGGVGTWNTTNGNWTTDAGANNVAWVNGNNDTAIFGGTAGAVTLGSDVTVGGLTFNTTNYSIAAGAGPYKITLGAATELNANYASNVNSMSGISVEIVGSSTITKTGTGYLRLEGVSDSFTGDVVVSGGTLQIGNNNTISRLGGATYAGNIALNGGNIRFTNDLRDTGAGPQTLSGIISGTGSFDRGGQGILTLTGANTYTGQTKIQGSGAGGPGLSVSSFNSVNATETGAVMASSSLGAPTTVANGTILFGNPGNQRGSTLIYTGAGETTNRVMQVGFNSGSKHTISNTGDGLLQFTSNFTINPSSGNTGSGLTLSGSGDGDIAQMGTIPGILEKADGGTWTIGGTNAANSVTVTGGTLIVNGTLNTAATGATPAGNISISSGGTLKFNSSAAQTLGAVISGAGALVKDNSGTLTLTAANSYTGATTVNSGTLLLSSTGSTAAGSAVSAAAGTVTGTPVATIAGSGTINGTLTLAGESDSGFKNGGVLSPGAAAGDIQTLNAGTTTWNGGSIWNFDLSSSNDTSDKLNITGDFVKGTGTLFEFNFQGSTPFWSETYVLAEWSGSLIDFLVSDFSYTGLGAGSYNDSSFAIIGNTLTFTAIPEPTSALAGLLLGAGLLRRRR